MNRINRWLSLLIAITALGGVPIASGIEADSEQDANPDQHSYLSTELISWDGQILKTEGGEFVVDSGVEVRDDREPNENGRLPEKAHVELTFDDGVLRSVVIY